MLQASFRRRPGGREEPSFKERNEWRDFQERIARERLERVAWDAKCKERMARDREQRAMKAEERQTWEIVELPRRNLERLCKLEAEKRLAEKTRKSRAALADEDRQEEGFAYRDGSIAEFRRWRASPALYRSYEGHLAAICAVAVSASLDCAVSASEDTTLKLWNFETGKCLMTFEGHSKAVRDCDLSPGFSLIKSQQALMVVSCSADRTVRIWDGKRGLVRKTLRSHRDVVYAAKFSPDGRFICSASADQTLRLWHAVLGYQIFVYRGHEAPVVSLAYSPSGKHIVSASDYGERAIKLWTTDMPATKTVSPVALRVEWNETGLADRLTFVLDPPKVLLEDPRLFDEPLKKRRPTDPDPWRDFLSDTEDDDDDDDPKKAISGTNKTKEVKEQEDSYYFRSEAFDTSEAGGFALSATSVDRFERSTRVETYYDSAWLQIVLRGVDDVADFYVSAQEKAKYSDTFSARSGQRCGLFYPKHLPMGTKITCDGAAVTANRRYFSPTCQITLWWRAPRRSTGPVLLVASVRGTDNKHHTLTCTLQEVKAPRRGSVMADIAHQVDDLKKKPSFDFTASAMHQLFIEFLRNEDFLEASTMLSTEVRAKIQRGCRTSKEESFGRKKNKQKGTISVRGREAVMDAVKRYASNGLSIIKDAKDIEPGKSMTVLLHGEPLLFQDDDDQEEEEKAHVAEENKPPPKDDDSKTRIKSQHESGELRYYGKQKLFASVNDCTAPGPETHAESHDAHHEQPEETIIDDQLFGCSLPHLRMKLPPTYPVASGRRRLSMTVARRQRGNYDKKPRLFSLQVDKEKRAREKKEEALLRWTRERTERDEASVRRHTQLVLPGFEPYEQETVSRGRSISGRLSSALSSLASSSRLLTFSSSTKKIDKTRAISSKINLKENKRRRRQSFATLPGFARRERGDVALRERKEEGQFILLKRIKNYGCLRTFYVETPFGNNVVHTHHHTVNEVAWSSDESQIASCSSDRTVRLWSPSTGRCVRTLLGHEGAVLGVSFLDDAGLRVLSCGLDNAILLWNALRGTIIRKFLGHSDAVSRVSAFFGSSAGAKGMMSCSADKTLKAWFLTPRRPAAPKAPTATDPVEQEEKAQEGDYAAVVTWRAPAAFNEDITAYKVQYRIGIRDSFRGPPFEASVDGATLQRIIKDLVPGQCYQFRVCAVNRMGQGDWSPPSKAYVTRVGLPLTLAEPIVLRKRATPRSITLCWHAPSATVEGTAIRHFQIECSGQGLNFGDLTKIVSWTEAATLAAELQTDLNDDIGNAQDGPASRGKGSRVSLKSTKGDDNQRPSESSQRTPNLENNSPQEQQVCLLSRLQHSKARGRRGAREAFEARKRREELERRRRALLSKSANVMAMEFGDLAPGHEYRFRVCAVSAVGAGPPSASTLTAATSSDRPSRPEPPTGYGLSRRSMKLQWVPPPENGAAITKYELQSRRDHEKTLAFSRYELCAEIGCLEPGSRGYEYRLRASNDCGTSDWSFYSSPLRTVAGRPETPLRPVVARVAIVSCSLRLAPLPKNMGEAISALRVQRRELRTGGLKTPWEDAAHVAVTSSSSSQSAVPVFEEDTGATFWLLSLASLKPQTVYSFRCAAINVIGPSDWSLPSLRAKTLRPEVPTAPAEPKIALIALDDDLFCDLTWQPANDEGSPIEGHILHLKTHIEKGLLNNHDNDDKWTPLHAGSLAEHRLEASPGSTYAFRVKALNAIGEGPFSPWSLPFLVVHPTS